MRITNTALPALLAVVVAVAVAFVRASIQFSQAGLEFDRPLYPAIPEHMHRIFATFLPPEVPYRDGTARQIYKKWFEQPLPGRGYSLDLPPDMLLNDTFRRPDGFVTDWTVL